MNTPEKWRQHVIVSGRSMRRLLAHTNLEVPEGQPFLALRGLGAYFPTFEGFDWRAECHAPQQTDAGLSDLRLVLDFLIDDSFPIHTEGPRSEFEAFMRSAS